MFSLLFLAKPTVLLQIDVFCGSRAEVVLRPIFVTWLCRACVRTRGFISLKCSRPGLVYTEFSGSRAEVVLRPIFVTWLCRACIWTRGLISLKFFTPWLHCVLWLQSRSCFTAILVTWLCRACVRTRGLISINFITPRSCLQFVLGIVAPAEVVSRQFLLPVSVKRFI